MAGRQLSAEEKLNNLMNAMAERVADTPFGEFVEEMREDGLDPERVASAARRIRLEALKNHRLRPLREARALHERRVAEYKSARAPLPGTPDTRRAAVDAILSGHRAASLRQITAQFRDLKEMTTEDVDSLYRQMLLLGVITPDAGEPEPRRDDES
jgi:hypothetical protein